MKKFTISELSGKCLCSYCDLQGSGTCIIEAEKTGHLLPRSISDKISNQISILKKEYMPIHHFSRNQVIELLRQLKD